MLIAVDIGNSLIKIGYFIGDSLIIQKIPTYPIRTSEEYCSSVAGFIQGNNIEKKGLNCIISSVVPGHTDVFSGAIRLLQEGSEAYMLILNHKTVSGISLNVESPEALGADRIANTAGAYALYKCPVAVIDFGTATTISVVDNNAQFMGGAIMPGLGLMNDVLAQKTSQLKKVELWRRTDALGRDTEACMRSGLLFGTAGAVERILDEIEAETGSDFKIVITGGNSSLIGGYLKKSYIEDSDLTLKGLKFLYENRRNK